MASPPPNFNKGPNSIVGEVLFELWSARKKFPPFHSSHEGFAIILEEVDELWDAVKQNQLPNARREAIQVAAMAIRFVKDLYPTTSTPE